MKPCPHTDLALAFEDGELEASKQLTMQEHVAACGECTETIELQRAIAHELRGTREAVPEGLRERLAARIVEEAALEEAGPVTQKRSAWVGRIVPFALAASVIGVMSVRAFSQGTRSARIENDLLAELVAEHSRPLPPERTDPKEVGQFSQYVGVPVKPGMFQKGTGTRLVGGRMLPVREERAAMLQYELGSGANARRVSVVVFDPAKIHVHDSSLAARPMGTSEVRVGRANGYSLAVTERGGVGYAVASDMDEGHTVEFASYNEE